MTKNKTGFRKFRFLLAAIVVFPIAIFFLLLIIAWTDLPDLSIIENPKSDISTQIISADGKVLRNLYDEKHRITIRLSEMSPHLLNALIATEDVRFFDHNGIDPFAFFAVAKDFVTGRKTRGGSTLSMQLSRNLYDHVGRERNLLRKAKEMMVAILLERKFTKEEILSSYLNTVSFHGNTYGVENGAKIFFGKEAKNLKVEEAALLVGLLKGTEYYNPLRHYERAHNRRNTILDQMLRYGFLEVAQCDSLKSTNIDLSAYHADDHHTGLAPYFTEHLRQWLSEWCKARNLNMYRDGLKVYTTIDSRMQTYAEEAAYEHLSGMQEIFSKHVIDKEAWKKDSTILTRAMTQSYRYISAKRAGKNSKEINEEFRTPIPMNLFSYGGSFDTVLSPWDSLKYYSKFLETGMMALDPSNGQIKAWVGGIDHKYFQYDHVYLGKRQVGSTFKPFVYCAAFDNGYLPCSRELNQPVLFYNNLGQMIWSPKNADGKVGGYMTLRRGLATSTNLITARIIKKIGAEVVCQYAHSMGITTELECVPSLALGTTDLSVYELTNAYATFVNKGVWIEPNFVTRIEDKNGNIIEEFIPGQREAINEKTAYLMLNMLMGVLDEPGGTAGRLRFRHKLYNQIGGKTGTTQNHSDGWFMGVTPHLSAGVWVGCSDRSMRFRTITHGQGASLALPIYGLFMEKVYADSTIGMPKDPFPRPREMSMELDCSKFKAGDFYMAGDSTGSANPKSVMDFDD